MKYFCYLNNLKQFPNSHKWKSFSRFWHFASRPEYSNGQSFPSAGDDPNPGIKARSPALQVDSLPAEPQRKPKNTEWVAYPISSGTSWPRNQTGVSCIAGRFITSWATREAKPFIRCYLTQISLFSLFQRLSNPLVMVVGEFHFNILLTLLLCPIFN